MTDLAISVIVSKKRLLITPWPENYPEFESYLIKFQSENQINKASQAIQSPRTVPFFLLVSLLDGYSFPNVLVKGIVAFKH